jgi:hypothetical protein
LNKLDKPSINFEQSIDSSIEGITGNPKLRHSVNNSRDGLIPGEGIYEAAASNGQLFSLPPLISPAGADPDPDPIVSSTLTKSDLIKLYDQYFAGTDKPARKYYDTILLAARDKCPYCGGIGRPRNLDHFLPKKYFPQFSVLPVNLVPSCRDCNMESKAQAYAKTEYEQILHPYFEDECFYTQQWVFAEFLIDDGGIFNYQPKPPGGWSESKKQRAIKHFRDFDLSKRYAIKAAEVVCIVLSQIETGRAKGLSNKDLSEAITSSAMVGAPFINHWSYAMYQAIETAVLSEGSIE